MSLSNGSTPRGYICITFPIEKSFSFYIKGFSWILGNEHLFFQAYMKKLAIYIISSIFISYVDVFSLPSSFKISIEWLSIFILALEDSFANTTDEFLSK